MDADTGVGAETEPVYEEDIEVEEEDTGANDAIELGFPSGMNSFHANGVVEGSYSALLDHSKEVLLTM